MNKFTVAKFTIHIHKEVTMNKTWQTRSLILGLFLLPFLITEMALAQNNVTFQVNMSIKMREGAFRPGSGDIVRVAGSFNDWGNSTDTLSDGNTDSIYAKTISLAAGSIDYKFLKTLRAGLDWESGNNRNYTVVGTATLPVVWFDYDSIYTPPVQAGVTFRVNMRVKILESTFQPQSGDIVRVAGSFNDWGNSLDTLKDADTDSIYTKTVNILEGTAIEYKFLKTLRAGLDWEGGNNKQYTVPVGGGTLLVVYFDGDSVINTPITANIIWRVDMRAMQNIGWYVPGTDSAQVRGGFEGWSGTRMTFDPISQTYRVTTAYAGTSFDQLPHKFFMRLDSATAVIRFPGFDVSGNRDGIQYDHPYERGDGNRLFDVQTGGNIVTPSYFFSSINSRGTLNNTTDTVRVTMQVNMGPATRDLSPFDPAADTVTVVFQDATWWRAQIGNQGAGNFAQEFRATRNGPTDSVYSVTFKIKGRAHYGLMYTWRYIKQGGTPVVTESGGGLGGQNLFRTRFIQPLGSNLFPATYSTPLDQWQPPVPANPLPQEQAPFGLTDVNDDGNQGQPLAYKLSQNYPNPFNPATRITYSIPEAGRVTLRVFNLLGQEVASLVNQDQAAGNYVALFEANKFSTGVYFYRLEAGKFSETKKMMLLK